MSANVMRAPVSERSCTVQSRAEARPLNTICPFSTVRLRRLDRFSVVKWPLPFLSGSQTGRQVTCQTQEQRGLHLPMQPPKLALPSPIASTSNALNSEPNLVP